MNNNNSYKLLNKVPHLLLKKTTMMREPISPHHRLAITLPFLASGNSFEDLKFLAAIAPQTIVIETCEAINKVLKNYINFRAIVMSGKRKLTLTTKFGTLEHEICQFIQISMEKYIGDYCSCKSFLFF